MQRISSVRKSSCDHVEAKLLRELLNLLMNLKSSIMPKQDEQLETVKTEVPSLCFRSTGSIGRGLYVRRVREIWLLQIRRDKVSWNKERLWNYIISTSTLEITGRVKKVVQIYITKGVGKTIMLAWWYIDLTLSSHDQNKVW